MNPLRSNRVAWSVAVAALALWATSVPVTWGNVASGAARLFDQETDDTTTGPNTSTTTIQIVDTTDSTDTTTVMTEPCVPIPPAIAEIVPDTPPPAAAAPGANEGSFRLCGPDPAVARAIEQLVAGRGFSASLFSRGDGCADLTIRVTSPVTSGTSSSSLNVSIGSGRNLSMRIVSEQGATRVTLSEG